MISEVYVKSYCWPQPTTTINHLRRPSLILMGVVAVETAPPVQNKPEHHPSTTVSLQWRPHYGFPWERSFLPILFHVMVEWSDLKKNVFSFITIKLSYLNLSNLNIFFSFYYISSQKKLKNVVISEDFDIMFDVFVATAKLAEQTYEVTCSSATGSAKRRTSWYVYRNREEATNN